MNGHEAAALFRQLAERLEKNAAEEFSGAFLIVPPGEGADAIDGLSVSSKPNGAVFWSSVSGQVEIAISEFKANSREGSARNGGYR